MPATRTRKGNSRKTSRGPSQATQDRQAEVELAVQLINEDAPDFAAFLKRWGTRYAEANLARLWVQCPQATALHRFGTWRGMGRQVKEGQHAIWLRIPHTSFDETKVSEANPEGKVFTGAPWMALFDYSQTQPIDGFEDGHAQYNLDPAGLAEVKRLRKVAMALHPDVTGDDTEAAHVRFTAAWLAYEAAKANLSN